MSAETRPPGTHSEVRRAEESLRLDHTKALAAGKRRDRSAFLRDVTMELVRAQRYGRPLSLGVIRSTSPAGLHESVWHSQRRALVGELHMVALGALRLPDFSARVTEEDFAVCLPETNLVGAGVAIAKMLAHERIPAICARFYNGNIGIDSRAVERGDGECDAEAFLARATAMFKLAPTP